MRAIVALVALAVLVGACSDDKDAGPSPTTQPATPTSLVDYTGVVLPGVSGETTTTIDERGTARLVGTVSGPAGPLAGATVRIDRLVAGREIRHDLITAADGRWELRDVPGGRYRVRAFLAPVYAQTTPEVQFLTDGDEHTFDLRVEDQRGLVVRADAAPDQPMLDGPVNLVVLVVQRTVGADGVVRAAPLSGTFVELTGLGRWVLRDDSEPEPEEPPDPFFDDTTTTTFDDGGSFDVGETLSEAGRARFELRCVRAGAPGLSLRIPVLVVAEPAPPGTGSTTGSTTTSTAPQTTTQEVQLELPACIDPATTTTTTTTPSSSTP